MERSPPPKKVPFDDGAFPEQDGEAEARYSLAARSLHPGASLCFSASSMMNSG
jgi:hypothetical protein